MATVQPELIREAIQALEREAVVDKALHAAVSILRQPGELQAEIARLSAEIEAKAAELQRLNRDVAGAQSTFTTLTEGARAFAADARAEADKSTAGAAAIVATATADAERLYVETTARIKAEGIRVKADAQGQVDKLNAEIDERRATLADLEERLAQVRAQARAMLGV